MLNALFSGPVQNIIGATLQQEMESTNHKIVQWNIRRTLCVCVCVCVHVYTCVRYSTVKKEKRQDELQQTAQKDLCTMTHTFGFLRLGAHS